MREHDSEPSLAEIKANQDAILSTFEQFKEKNDARIEEIEKRGAEDPVAREQVEKITEEIKGLKEIREKLEKLMKQAARPGGAGDDKERFTAEQIEHRDAFLNYVRHPDDERARVAVQEAERKAVSTTTDATGGSAVPEIISRRIERELAEISPLRQIVDVQRAGSKDFKILVDRRGATYGWVGETDTRNETGTPTLAEVAPTFGMIYAYPKATEESLDDMFFNVEQWLVNAIVEGFAEGEEAAIVSGNGTKKPTGFLNGTPVSTGDNDSPARAFGTLQYVPTGFASTFGGSRVDSPPGDPADVFLSTIYQLKKGYRANARWLMNKSAAGTIMKFKDADGDYLWRPGMQMGQPDRIFGYPVSESEQMPDIAANAFPVAFGDFRAGYVLCDLVGFRLTRDEITTPGYIKWYARRRLGGKVKKDESIKLIKCAAS